MPQARRFNKFEIEGTAADIDALLGIELEPRALRPERDLVVPLPPAPEPVPAIGVAASA